SGRAGRRGDLHLRRPYDFVPGSDQLLSRGGMGAMDTARDREIVSTGGLGGLEGARLRRDVEVVFAGGGVRRAADIRRWNAVHALHGDRLLGQLHLFVARAWTGRAAIPLALHCGVRGDGRLRLAALGRPATADQGIATAERSRRD